MYYIYRIINLINGKTYIGQRKLPENKTIENDNYYGSEVLIIKAEKKYGIENLKKEILIENIKTKELIDELEKKFIADERLLVKIGKIPECYNIADGGKGSTGYIVTEETKKKLSEINKGKHLMIEDNKRKLLEARKKHFKKIICIETGIIYNSIAEAKRECKISHISDVCSRQLKTAGGFHWEYYNK